MTGRGRPAAAQPGRSADARLVLGAHALEKVGTCAPRRRRAPGPESRRSNPGPRRSGGRPATRSGRGATWPRARRGGRARVALPKRPRARAGAAPPLLLIFQWGVDCGCRCDGDCPGRRGRRRRAARPDRAPAHGRRAAAPARRGAARSAGRPVERLGRGARVHRREAEERGPLARFPRSSSASSTRRCCAFGATAKRHYRSRSTQRRTRSASCAAAGSCSGCFDRRARRCARSCRPLRPRCPVAGAARRRGAAVLGDARGARASTFASSKER